MDVRKFRARSPESNTSSRISARSKPKSNSPEDKRTLALKQEVWHLRKTQKEMREKNKFLTQELAKVRHEDTLKIKKAENDIADLMQIQNQLKQRSRRDMLRVKGKDKTRINALESRLRIMFGEQDEVDLEDEEAVNDLLETLTNELEKSVERYAELTKQNEKLYSEKVELEATLTLANDAALRRNQELQDRLYNLENKSNSKSKLETSHVRELHLQIEMLQNQLKNLLKTSRRTALFIKQRKVDLAERILTEPITKLINETDPSHNEENKPCRGELEAGAHK